MKRQLNCMLLIASLLVGVLTLSSCLGPRQPKTMGFFDFLQGPQDIGLQYELESLLPDSISHQVTGPIGGTRADNPGQLDGLIRVIFPDLASLIRCGNFMERTRFRGAEDGTWTHAYWLDVHLDRNTDTSMGSWASPPFPLASRPFRGMIGYHMASSALWGRFALLTTNQNRFIIWSSRFASQRKAEFLSYAQAITNYLYSLDTGWMEAPAPKAVDYGLPDSLDFYADPPDYVIEGYENYQNFLHSHDTIWTDFASGVTSFVPSDSLWEAMKINAPREAYPNKEWPMLQHEYRKFFERGGDVRVMNTLTREGFDTLQESEYFFAVSVAGKVRFGRELLRAEVKQIEEETGKKVPRANHAFLFPGEPVLTAGAFFIEATDNGHRLSHINAQSGHYFYSNVSPTIREDIAERSDHYLLTLGHFFAVLDSLGIPHDNVVISKL